MKKSMISIVVLAVSALSSTASWASSINLDTSDIANGQAIQTAPMVTRFTNIQTGVNDNDTRLTGVINNTQAGTLKTEVDKIQGIINNTQAGTLKTTVDGHTTSINTLTTDVNNLKGGVPGATCTGNPGETMVRVGSICVDKYEASIVNGVARSVIGVLPSIANWATAADACAQAGKRLPSNAEWQMATAGHTGTCNVAPSAALANTDANPSCQSKYGVVNMVGNIAEWVGDWSGDAGNGTGEGGVATTSSALSQARGIVRGGDATDIGGIEWMRTAMDLNTAIQSGNTIGNGFRCVR
jgi:hypothetical protein